jgi:pimeloyl-ACP methyl ester carboxylesterase
VAESSYTRTPYLVVHHERQARKDVYGSIDDAVVLQSQLLRGDDPGPTALIGMHPIGAPGYLPMFSQLARSGYDVVACATRYSTGDAALQMENVLTDLAACVRHTREKLGYEQVVLVGWSGGGSVMAGYQAEAEQRTITQTAAGEPTPLADAELLGADGLLLLATHRSRHQLLTGQLDASITDELHPERRPVDLDLYDATNPNQPPYDPAFLDAYRAAQLTRNRRITAWVKDELAALRQAGREDEERCFVVHGTMADPRWVDPTVDPNGRRPNWTYMGDPRTVNDSPAGLGRFTCLRSWLSQWSYDDAQVDIVDAGPRISVPALVITAGADDACPVSHTAAIVDSLASEDLESHTVEDANHYFSGPGGKAQLLEAMAVIDSWMKRQGFTA